MKKLSYWLNGKLPIYLKLPTMKRLLSPANKGYTLAIWNCGDCKHRGNLLQSLCDTRITLRKDGMYWKTIKKGDYEPIRE